MLPGLYSFCTISIGLMKLFFIVCLFFRQMRFVLILTFFGLLPFISKAGGEYKSTGARSSALGNASVTLTDIWSAFNNQAGLAQLTSPELAFSYENKFLMKELASKAACFAYPYKNNVFNLNFSQFGFSSYNDNKISLGYSRKFGKYLSIGVQLNYGIIQFDEQYESLSFITFEAGAIYKLNRNLSLGVHVYNPNNSYLRESSERVPAILRMGATYILHKDLMLTTEIEKNIYNKAEFKSGIEYRCGNTTFLRAGVSTGKSPVHFGVGFSFRKIILELSSEYHQLLGFSPQSSISIRF